MKPELPKKLVALASILLLSGCAELLVAPEPVQPVAAVDDAIAHTLLTSSPQACGSLNQFLFDVHKLSKQSQKRLLDELSAYKGDSFSCDRLKTGLLLSQIGKTAGEDNLALELLGQYRKSEKLTYSDQRLITILIRHTEERKRLHLLLKELGNQLVSEKALSKIMVTNVETLQQKLNQLQKLESEINETEQSISTPATTSLSETPSENTGS